MRVRNVKSQSVAFQNVLKDYDIQADSTRPKLARGIDSPRWLVCSGRTRWRGTNALLLLLWRLWTSVFASDHEDRCMAYFKKKLSGLHIRWASCKLWIAFVLKEELQKSGLHSSGMTQQLYIIPLPRTQRFVQSSRFARLQKSTYWMICKRYFSNSPIAGSYQSLLCKPCLAFQLLFNYFSFVLADHIWLAI